MEAYDMATETIVIKGITYEVTKGRTPEQLEADGLVNTARRLRSVKASRDLWLKRPRSQGVNYTVIEWCRPNGKRWYGHVVNVGR